MIQNKRMPERAFPPARRRSIGEIIRQHPIISISFLTLLTVLIVTVSVWAQTGIPKLMAGETMGVICDGRNIRVVRENRQLVTVECHVANGVIPTPTAVPTEEPVIEPTAVPPTPLPPEPDPIDPPPPSVCSDKNILLVSFDVPTTGDDALMVERLTQQGYTVTVAHQKQVSVADAAGMDLILISSSTTTPLIRTMFRETAVPVMIWEARWFRTMNLTLEMGRSYGELENQTHGVIANPAHPLAAGLNGTVPLATTPSLFAWGAAHETAATALTSVDGQPLLYGYEMGAMMEQIPAPARRVVYYGGTASQYTPEAWLLFETAVGWAMGCR